MKPPKESKLTTCLNNLLTTEDKYRTSVYWLWHDLLDNLDIIAPEEQDWIDDISSNDEQEEIINVNMQPDPAVLQNLLVLVRSECDGTDEVHR